MARFLRQNFAMESTWTPYGQITEKVIFQLLLNSFFTVLGCLSLRIILNLVAFILTFKDTKTYRPFPNFFKPFPQSDRVLVIFLSLIWKWDFIHLQIKLICAPGLALMERLKVDFQSRNFYVRTEVNFYRWTRKWAINRYIFYFPPSFHHHAKLNPP